MRVRAWGKGLIGFGAVVMLFWLVIHLFGGRLLPRVLVPLPYWFEGGMFFLAPVCSVVSFAVGVILLGISRETNMRTLGRWLVGVGATGLACGLMGVGHEGLSFFANLLVYCPAVFGVVGVVLLLFNTKRGQRSVSLAEATSGPAQPAKQSGAISLVDGCALVLTLGLGLGIPGIVLFDLRPFFAAIGSDLGEGYDKCIVIGTILSGLLLGLFLFHLRLLFPDRKKLVVGVALGVYFYFFFVVIPFAVFCYWSLHFFDNMHMH